MTDWPTYAEVLLAGYGEEIEPAVERTEMERGVPKQRLLNTQVLRTLMISVLFRRAADAAQFERWYFDDLKRIAWFSMRHPRTGETITARFQNGSIGRLTPLKPAFGLSQRDMVVEYLR